MGTNAVNLHTHRVIFIIDSIILGLTPAQHYWKDPFITGRLVKILG